MDVRDSIILRDCIAQLCYANGALRSRDTARIRSNVPEMYSFQFEGNRLRCPDGLVAVIHFHSTVPPTFAITEFAVYRGFHHAPGGMSIMVMGSASFHGKYLSCST